ncbi:MAG TPA: nuclear transport factor 2 family protein [Methylomirabilota bacterium]|nr:nuclear transport factor 2 family protein [Methylomirabilota bacterium]
MSTEQNAALVRRYFAECVSGASGPHQPRALAAVDELLSADFAMFYNSQTDAEATRGRERHKEFLVGHAQTFPDDHWTIEALVADEQLVACRWRIQANHAKSGNHVDVRAADFFSVRTGQLAELRRFLDFKDLDQQVRAPAAHGDRGR